MYSRAVVTLLTLAGIGLLGGALYLCSVAREEPNLLVAQSDIDMGECVAEEDMDIVFHLQNNAGRPIPVLGLVAC
jgi:hypothetical protein